MYPLAFALAGLTLGHAPVESFEFAPGRMDGWEGDGYYLTCGTAKGPGRTWGVCTSDAGAAGRKAQLNRSFKVEDNVTSLRGRGFINLASGCTADHRLDMVLLDENKVRVPKQLFTASGWVETTGFMPRWKGLACEYLWDLTSYRGQTLKLVIRDLDDRPGCHIYASGFHLLGTAPTAVAADGDFASFMQQLEDKHTLLPMHDYKSKRFRAIGNASQKFSIQHLKYCEIFYDQFVNHFRARGFAVQPPADKQLMIAIFSEPKGFEAYLGRRMPPGITGVYHTLSNRLVLYDLSQNAYLLASRDEALKRVELFSPHDRMRVSDTVERRYKDAAKDANIGTTMHECAHLLSFNSGLLQRGGDVPVWLAEGLATYCESTDEGDWQSLGSPNPMRIHDLRRARGNFLSVQDLMRDNWLNSNAVLLGYAQSWALYHMLMKERPAQLNKYLQTIAARRVPEYRLADFVAAFGDVQALEQRYRSYMNDLIQRYPYRDAR